MIKINKTHLIAIGAVALALMPEVAYASTGAQDYGLTSKFDEMTGFLNGKILPFSGGVCGVMTLVNVFWDQNYYRALGFGGAAIGSTMVDPFVKSVFSSGMLLG
jgi:hypothetical protein